MATGLYHIVPDPNRSSRQGPKVGGGDKWGDQRDSTNRRVKGRRSMKVCLSMSFTVFTEIRMDTISVGNCPNKAGQI
jgi:hypothetical protein